MASITELRQGKFRVRVTYRDAGGRWRTRSRTVYGSRVEAEQEAAALERLKATGRLHPTLTLAGYADLWLASIEATLAPHTLRGYRVNVERHIKPALGHMKLHDLQTLHVDTMLSAMSRQGLAPRTIQYARAVLRLILARAVDDNLIHRNPAAHSRSPRLPRREMGFLAREQAARLVEAASDTFLFAPVILGAFAGLRRGEICGLRWPHVDLERGEISVVQALQKYAGQGAAQPLALQGVKSHRSVRSLPIPPTAVDLLRAWRNKQHACRLAAGTAWEEGGWVCTGPHGGPLDPPGLSRDFRALASSLGLDVRLHDLRHTYAYFLRRSGVDIKVIQVAMGHACPAFTLRAYGHIDSEDLRDAAAKLDLFLTRHTP